MSQPRAFRVVAQPNLSDDMLADWVVLDHADRHRRRLALTGQNGVAFLLDLEKPAALADGDVLALDDGRLIGVRAAPQRLYAVRAADAAAFARAAWHVGNRHTPAEIAADVFYIEEDHVLGDMLRGLGCAVTSVERPFHPERGAYAQGGPHGHSHGTHHHHAH